MSLRRHGLHLLLGTLLLVLTVVLLYRGWGFYGLSLEDRVEHPDFRVLRPSGSLGNGYGFIALALTVANLAYLVRRHVAGARLGPMRIWLDLHVFTGLSAAVLATFHSAFQLRSPIAQASAASLAIVVLTGLIGRFFHALGPGDEATRLRLALDAVEGAPPRRAQGGDAREALRLVRAASDAEARAAGIAALVRSWRGLHRFFAMLMLVAVGLHAGVAWYFGYRWVFS